MPSLKLTGTAGLIPFYELPHGKLAVTEEGEIVVRFATYSSENICGFSFSELAPIKKENRETPSILGSLAEPGPPDFLVRVLAKGEVITIEV